MSTGWTVRTKPIDETVNVLFDDQFKLFDDPDIPFDGIIYRTTKWTVRQKP